ncbi:MAG: beta strand repeat-containing protein [Chthoniobacterales bacterium]
MKTTFPLPRRAALIALLLLLAGQLAHAGSAAWNLNPTSGDWNTAANWTPATVPNGQSDIATFGLSNNTNVSLSLAVSVSEVVFSPGASGFTISFAHGRTLNLYGAGITNNSGTTQNFLLAAFRGVVAQMVFHNSATAGNGTVFMVEGNGPLSSLLFLDTSSAGTATFTATGSATSVTGSAIDLAGTSTAAQATFINDGGIFSGGQGGLTNFLEDATADQATCLAHGGIVSGALGGFVLFGNSSTAGNATLIADGGVSGAAGGVISFLGLSNGGSARVELFANGSLDLKSLGHGLTIGSLEGDGVVSMGAVNLTVGGNDLNTLFSGVIGAAGDSGGLSKIGTGVLTLSGANLYSGGTTMSQGTLVLANVAGSATGAGTVQVDAGTLGGSGIVSGAVTIGTGSGPGAFLAPAHGSKMQSVLTIQSALIFNADSTYTYTFKAKKKKAKTDEVIANGVTINGGTFNFSGTVQGVLKQGLVLTAISNTAATPTNGTFSNLADGVIVTVNGNNLQASYEGGDGNDLTLTVLPQL